MGRSTGLILFCVIFFQTGMAERVAQIAAWGQVQVAQALLSVRFSLGLIKSYRQECLCYLRPTQICILLD